MLNISIPLSSVISELNVKCTNVGCSWVGEHGSKERHQETGSFLLLECPNGCPGSHLRDSLERHLEICPQEKVPCKYFTTEVERYILDQHEPTCQEKPGPCPLNCGHNLPRSHVHLHLDECPKRMMKCSVAGCNNFYQLGMENAHNELYQGSHRALLKSQVESLQRAIYDKSQVAVKRELSKRKCYRWTVPKSSIRIPKDISSPLFGFESHTFRCLWKRTSGQNRLFLNAVFGSSPITVQTRFVLLNEDGVMSVFDTECETLMEDQIIGAKEDLGPIEKEQDLIIKLIIAIYKFT